MSAHIVPFTPSSTSALFHLAYDAPTEAAIDLARGRVALREIGVSTPDATEAWRVLQLLRQAEQDIVAAQALVQLHFEQLERR